MQTRFSEQDLAFQQEVRQFLEENYSEDLNTRVQARETFKPAIIEWQRILHRQGWIAPGWPVELGGTDWTDTQRFIYENERAHLGVPDVNPFGLKMVGPVIYTFGTKEQQEYFLPRILASEDWWCQGYSEPGAGSDLASLQTRAVRDGDDYIVNGSKIWTTNAQHADWMFCLVRTDPDAERKQQGISFVLIDMKTPGIAVSPIISLDGRHSLNEVAFDEVRVPIANCIGEENKGWTYAKALLAHERTAIAGVADSKREIRLLKETAGRELNNGRFSTPPRGRGDGAHGARVYGIAGPGFCFRRRLAGGGVIDLENQGNGNTAGTPDITDGRSGPVRRRARNRLEPGGNRARFW